MGLDYADYHVLPAAVAAYSLTQHAIGFADTRCIAEEKLEDSLRLFRGDFFQPLFGALLHEEHFHLSCILCRDQLKQRGFRHLGSRATIATVNAQIKTVGCIAVCALIVATVTA